jgi:hypothetical protein
MVSRSEARLHGRRSKDLPAIRRQKNAPLRNRNGLVLGGVLLGTSACLGLALCLPQPDQKPGATAPASRTVFERRILPILKSAQPSTCAECHLSGVDLKDYIQPTERATFLALRDQKLIDVKRPENSHLLRLIRMSTPKTPLLTQKARDTEYAAFRDWIEAVVKDPALATAPRQKAAKRTGPKVANAVIRHTRKDQALSSFERNVWLQEGRCMNCHREGTPENAEHLKKYGKRVAWFVANDPEETMRRILAQGLVNVQTPEQSLLLLKPLNKVPHGGGVKFLYGDTGYKMFRAWIEDYAKSVQGKYRSAKDLPAPSREELVYTQAILNVNIKPGTWSGKLLRVDAYPWDTARNGWAKQPIATGDREMPPNGSTNLLMFKILPLSNASDRAARSAPRLTPGRYLLKYYVDTTDRLKKDFTLPTNHPSFFQGEQEITAKWRLGWGDATHVQVALRSQ